MLTAARSNGVDTNYSYDDAGRLTGIEHAAGASVIDEFVYSLDSNGNRTQVVSNAGTETYTLDALNRLTNASYPGGLSESFEYDAAGNRTSHSKTDGTTVGFTVDATGQLISDTSGTTYTYDAAGNLTGTSDGESYTYDDYGRHVSISAGGVTQTYGYDAANVRVTVDGQTQLWDRNGGLPTLISTGDGDNYVHTAGVSRDGDGWLLADAVGSVRTVVDNTGAATGSQSFTAFGEQLTGSGTFGFAGEQQDPTGLQHLRARQYNPALGRFTTVDPVQPGAPGTTGYNLYAYAGDNPTTWTDPSGQAVAVETGSLYNNAAKRAATLTAFQAGRQAALQEIARQAATRALMLQIRQFLSITGRTIALEVAQDIRMQSEQTATKSVRTDREAKITPSVITSDPAPEGSGSRNRTQTGECPDLGPGSVSYGPLLSREWDGTQRGVVGEIKQFATGASAVLTPDFLQRNATETAPSPSPSPAGYDGRPYSRAHLIAASLGGSNTNGANFVSLHQNKNSGRMRVLEGKIANTVSACDLVTYAVTPTFDYATPQPLVSLQLLAVSADSGVIVNESIMNTDRLGRR